MTKPNLTIEERFWEKVDIRGPDECWNWLAGKKSNGYGTFWIKGERVCPAHRIAWELTNGEIPKGMSVLHHCDNRLCCNPKCLFLGTHEDNMSDMCRKGRQARGISLGQTKLSEEQVLEIRNLRQKGMLLREIAELYSINKSRVSEIYRKISWKHI